ncbi:MAG TPA: hypothetical protein VHL09_01415 [Dehalococcoidia bacterium]|nr:hypothetical protein [Dehalococcoidia bacterium]
MTLRPLLAVLLSLCLIWTTADLAPPAFADEGEQFELAGPIVDVTILPHSSIWYWFDYPGDNSLFAVTIQYAPVPAGDTQQTMLVGFNAYQPDGTYIGRSTDVGGGPGRRFWLMSSYLSGAYLVEVVNHSYHPVVFSFAPSTAPQPQLPPAPAPASIAPAIPAESADYVQLVEAFGRPSLTTTSPGGTSPVNARLIAGAMLSQVGPGESRWYRFWYSGVRGRALIGLDFGQTSRAAADAPVVNVYRPDLDLVGWAEPLDAPGNVAAWSIDSSRFGYYYLEVQNPGPRGADYRIVALQRR